MSMARDRDLEWGQDGIQGTDGSGASVRSWVACKSCEVSGVGGRRMTAGIDEEATSGKGGGRVNGGGGGD